MKKHILTTLLLACSLLVYSQRITKVYYDKNWKTVKATDTVAYYRLVKLDSKCKALDVIHDYYADGKLYCKTDGASYVDTLNDKNTKYKGIGIEYYESGDKKSKIIRNDTGAILSNIGWYENGKLRFTEHYASGKEEDTAVIYYMNGAIMIKQPYVNDKKTGIRRTYSEDGALLSQAIYVNDLLNGSAKKYYEGGNLKEEANYINDTIEGVIKYYYISGKPEAEIWHLKGKMDGSYKVYYESGVLKASYEYKAGKLNGEETEYWESKLLKRRDLYNNDSLQNGKCYDNTGKEESYYKLYPSGPADAQTPDFIDVLQMPEFKGDFNKYLGKTINYPQKEREGTITGTVYIKFIIEKDGSIGKVTVLKGVPHGAGLDAEAVRVISGMPKWKPGMQNGLPVKVSLNIPIRFTLQ